LLDATNRKPLADREIQYGVRFLNSKQTARPRVASVIGSAGAVKTDTDGRFKLVGLMIGAKYDVDVPIHEEAIAG